MKIIFPEKLLITYRDPTSDIYVWDRILKKRVLLGLSGSPAFAVDASSEKMVATARKWGKYEKIVDNKSISIRIIGYEYRAGTLVFKVLSNDGFIFDLRDDEGLFTLINYGIKDNFIDTKFIWSKKGAHMKLVQEDRPDEIMIQNILV